MAKLPHVLHLEIDKYGWVMWSLDCPYSATEIDDQPGRTCRLVEETMTPYPERPHGPDTFYSRVDDKLILVYRETKEPVTGDALETWNTYLQASDDYEQWVSIPGCFAQQYLNESGFDDLLCLEVMDPRFPLEVDVKILGCNEDAYVDKVVPWTTNP